MTIDERISESIHDYEADMGMGVTDIYLGRRPYMELIVGMVKGESTAEWEGVKIFFDEKEIHLINHEDVILTE